MRFEKGSPEAKAFMAKLREEGAFLREKKNMPRTKILAAQAEDSGVATTFVQDSKGNAAGAMSLSEDALARILMKVEAREERQRAKARDEMTKKLLIGAGGLAVVYLLFFRTPTTAKTA